MTDYTKEAERLYPALNKNDYDEWTLTMLSETLEHQRAAHIAARQQSAAEIDRLRGEVEMLKKLLENEVLREFGGGDSVIAQTIIWQQFKTENNIQ